MSYLWLVEYDDGWDHSRFVAVVSPNERLARRVMEPHEVVSCVIMEDLGVGNGSLHSGVDPRVGSSSSVHDSASHEDTEANAGS